MDLILLVWFGSIRGLISNRVSDSVLNSCRSGTAVENHGGGGIVMPRSSPQYQQLCGQFRFFLCLFVFTCFYLRKSGENSMCPGFNLRVPTRVVGAKRHA